MKPYHILNGDSLADQLRLTKINQDFIICRECLIEGNVQAGNLSDFWKTRAEFISSTYNVSTEEYYNKTVSEFEKLNSILDNAEICLWFENDLFCQANMWFVIFLLSNRPGLKIFRIFPLIENGAETWKGFGISNSEMLEQAYNLKIEFTPADIELGYDLWTAYQNSDLDKLKVLSKKPSKCFQYLEEVCQAHVERFPHGTATGRPDKVVKEIIETSSTDFQSVLSEFSMREGIYGFGDVQLKTIYDRQMQSM